MNLNEFLHHLHLQILKIPYAGNLSGNRSNFIDSEVKILWYNTCTKKYIYIYLKINDVTKESQYSTKIKYILLTHFLEEHIFGMQLSQVDLKTAAMLYS